MPFSAQQLSLIHIYAIDAALHELETGKETPKGAQEKADQAKAEAISACRPIVARTSGTGSAYEVTIDGVTAVSYTHLDVDKRQIQNGIMTPNECRAKEDLPPREGGDELFGNAALAPVRLLAQGEALKGEIADGSA